MREDLLERLNRNLERATERRGSRHVGPGAKPSLVEHIANGGSYSVDANDPTRSRDPEHRTLTAGLVFGMKALAEATGSAGGYLVPVEIADEIVTMLRARSAVNKLGPTTIPVEKELDVTSLTSGAAAAWVAENAPIPVSEQTFAQSALLRPKELGSIVPVSNRLLRDAQGSPDIERVVREDIAEVLALKEDLAFIQGTGAANEPLGIRNVVGTTPGPNLGANGSTPTFDHLKDIVASVRALNAPFRRPGWLFHSRLLSTLEKIKDGQQRYLADAGLLTFDATGSGGTLLGYRFETTSQIPTNITVGSSTDATYIIFSSDWAESFIGENQSLTLELSAEAAYQDSGANWQSAFQNRQTLFRAVRTVDFALRRPQLWVLTTGVRP